MNATTFNQQHPVDDLEACARVLRECGWWSGAPFGEHWPLSTSETADLFAANGYFVDASEINDLVARRLVRPPSIGLDGYEWNADDVLALGGLLELRKQFAPTPCKHDERKVPAQIILEQARYAGTVEELLVTPDGGRPDVVQLLRAMIEADHKGMRESLAVLLKAALEVENGVFLP